MKVSFFCLLVWPAVLWAETPAQLLKTAKDSVVEGDPCAYLRFTAIPEGSPERAEAERLLDTAEKEFVLGLTLLDAFIQEKKPELAEQVEESIAKGRAIAPMRPRILFQFADAFFAAESYRLAASYYKRGAFFSGNVTESESFCEEPLKEDEVIVSSTYLQVVTIPAEAEVFVDGILRGTTPAKITEGLTPGKHTIIVRKKGFGEISQEKDILQGTLNDVTMVLPAMQEAEPQERALWPFYLGAGLSVLALGLAGLYWRSKKGKGITLEEFAQKVPEVGPEIAREIATIRHELIKHRLGLTPALTKANEQEGVRDFVLARLGGDLEGDFERHVESLQRIASGRLEDAWDDPILRPLARAVKNAARTSRKLASQGDIKKAHRELALVREDLLTADRALARLVSALGQTTLDAAFLRDAVASVRKEPRIQSLPLDAINYAEIAPAPQVAIPKVDLNIVVKNLVRNALLALQDAKGKRQLSLEVELEVELTGEESVLLKIKDSAPGLPELEHTPAGRGLWIVQKTLGRYDGAVLVQPEPENSPFTKTVVVRLFRAM